jgi:hypothetical protein
MRHRTKQPQLKLKLFALRSQNPLAFSSQRGLGSEDFEHPEKYISILEAK